RRRHTRFSRDWSSDVCSSDLHAHPADLIKFNLAHCPQEMKYFGQEVFDLAEQTTGLGDPVYLDARALCLEKTRSQGIDKVIADRSEERRVGKECRCRRSGGHR